MLQFYEPTTHKQNILSVRSSTALNDHLNCADAKGKVCGAGMGNARKFQTQSDKDTMQESKGQSISSRFTCIVSFGKQ
jgi:hypothetical protein